LFIIKLIFCSEAAQICGIIGRITILARFSVRFGR